MKRVLCICDWDYSLFWRQVALMLKGRGRLNYCAALVVGRIYYDQLRRETPNPFDQMYLLQDAVEGVPDDFPNLEERLKELEATYGNLWRFLWADRTWVRAPYREARIRMAVCFNYFEDLYRREAPEIILTNAYGSMPHLVAFAVATQMGIPILRPLSIRLEDRYILTDSALEEEPWIAEYLAGRRPVSAEVMREVDAFLERFRRDVPKPLYQKLLAGQHRVTAGHFYRFFRYARRYWFSSTFAGEHTKKNPITRLRTEIVWRARRKRLLAPEAWDRFEYDQPYVYFPLHVQPEASTMTNAPWYLDQLFVVESLSKALPVSYRLILKEHPSMLGRRKGDFYDRLRSLPNVLLVHPVTDGSQLLKNTSLVFTISGTAGLEGLLLGKPVIALGATYWANHCPLVMRGDRVPVGEWGDVVRFALERHAHDDEVLKRFLGAVFSQSFHGNFVEPLAALSQILEPDNLEPLIEAIEGAYKQRIGGKQALATVRA